MIMGLFMSKVEEPAEKPAFLSVFLHKRQIPAKM